jgi:hypothetical protein
MSSIFLCHSSADAEVSRTVAQRLRAIGHTSVFLDFDPEQGIPVGRVWERELYRRLRACRVLILILSEASLRSRWCFAEVVQARLAGKPILPLRVGRCDRWEVLAELHVRDWPAEPAAGEALLRAALEAQGVVAGGTRDWNASRPPYPGLAAYEEADAGVYFGREDSLREAVEALNRLRNLGTASWLVVVGASGAGKSSLLRAGLVPRLRAEPERWLVVEPFRPGSDALAALMDALARTRARCGDAREPSAVRRELERSLRGPAPQAGARSVLDDVLLDLRHLAGRPEARVVLSLDQAEELFAPRQDSDSTLELLSLLSASAAEQRPICVATLRSDALGEIQQCPALRGQRFEHLLLGPLGSADLREIIARPAEMAGLALDEGLLEELVADAEQPNALPLLAFALRELWERGREEGRLSRSTYREALGGLSGAVARSAEAILRRRNPADAERRALRRTLTGLAYLAHEGRWAKRSVASIDVPEEARGLVQEFAQARLLVQNVQAGEPKWEVAHEALFTAWAPLKSWLEESREALTVRGRVAETARRWLESGRRKDLLLGPGLPLEETRRLDEADVDLSTLEREFLAASRLRARRESRVRRLAVTTIALLAVGASVFAWQKARAEGEAREASQAATHAREESERARGHGDRLRRELADVLTSLATTFVTTGRIEEGSRAAARAESNLRELTERDPWNPQLQIDLATALTVRGDVHSSQGQREAALAAFRDAVAVLGKAGAQADTPQLVAEHAAYLRLGGELLALGDAVAARSLFERAIEVGTVFTRRHPTDLDMAREQAVAWSRLGDAFEAQNDWRAALDAYRAYSSGAARVSAGNPADLAARREHVVSRGKLAHAFGALEDRAAQREHLAAYAAGTRDLLERAPENLSWRFDHLVALSDQALVLQAAGDLEAAADALREALATARSTVILAPADTRWGLSIGHLAFVLADVEEDLGKGQEALAGYAASAEALDRLLLKTDNSDWRHRSSISWYRVGVLRRVLGEGAGAILAFKKAASLAADLAARKPENLGLQEERLISLDPLAVTLLEQRELPDAKATAAEALQIATGLAGSGQPSAEHAYLLGRAQLRVAQVLEAMGSPKAVEAYSQALASAVALDAALGAQAKCVELLARAGRARSSWSAGEKSAALAEAGTAANLARPLAKGPAPFDLLDAVVEVFTAVGDLHRRAGDEPAAQAFYKQALEALEHARTTVRTERPIAAHRRALDQRLTAPGR